MTEGELASQDVAVVNLACAAGLPGCDHLDVERIIAMIDDWSENVRKYTACQMPRFERDPVEFGGSEAYFKMLCLVTRLQRDLGVRYNPAKIDPEATFFPEDTFLHGVVRGEGGTCASMPVLYAAVGRRLGYPLRLVTAYGGTANHGFVRWDDPRGERLNIDAAGKGMCSDPDDYYRRGRYAGLTPELERDGHFLESKTPQMDLSCFMADRARYLAETGGHRQCVEAWAFALALSPWDRFTRGSLSRAMRAWQAELDRRKPLAFPNVYLKERVPVFLPALWDDLRQNVLGMMATENLLNNPELETRWWSGLRQGRVAPGLPGRAQADFYADGACEIGLWPEVDWGSVCYV